MRPLTLDRERRLGSRGFLRVAGVDEAGRGALAGPVVAAAVILPEEFDLQDVRDSKLIPEHERDPLAEAIKSVALSWSTAQATVEEIDRINILNASMLAMQRAVRSLRPDPDYICVDGNRYPELTIPGETIIGGDNCCLSIAAASILAKVHRDRILRELHDSHELYSWDTNKGYGTPVHRHAILEHGPTGHHRSTFLRRLMQEKIDFEVTR